MCFICNLTENDIVETALAVQSTVNGDYMTIPLKTSVEQIHSFEVIPVSYTHLTLPTMS
mgnify:FL=1